MCYHQKKHSRVIDCLLEDAWEPMESSCLLHTEKLDGERGQDFDFAETSTLLALGSRILELFHVLTPLFRLFWLQEPDNGVCPRGAVCIASYVSYIKVYFVHTQV